MFEIKFRNHSPTPDHNPAFSLVGGFYSLEECQTWILWEQPREYEILQPRKKKIKETSGQ